MYERAERWEFVAIPELRVKLRTIREGDYDAARVFPDIFTSGTHVDTRIIRWIYG
jgi:hypothetical protein